MKLPKISVIVAFYNEEIYINGLLESIKNQNYDLKKIEYIFIDSNSTDNTKNILNDFKKKNKILNIKILSNPKRKTPISFNIGLKNASNDIVFILGAHSEYPKHYFKKCVGTLIEKKCDNAGGIMNIVTLNKGLEGKIIRYITTSKFGVGNSMFRTSIKSCEADTVLFFCFYKKIIENIGYFDERLHRNQDNEMNYRLRKNHHKIWQDSSIVVKYFNVDSLKKLYLQAFTAGKWNIWTLFIQPFALSFRHFIPFFFVLYILSGIIFCIIFKLYGLIFLAAALIPYIILNILFSLFSSIKDKSFIFIFLFPSFFLYHITYGIGSLFGLFIVPFKLKDFSIKKRGW